MRIVIATGNKDKVREINELLEGTDFEAVSMKEAGISCDIVEDADSFQGNALIKAKAVAEYTDDYVLADDSGICIDALDGAPGIYSSRFCGEDSTYEEKFKNGEVFVPEMLVAARAMKKGSTWSSTASTHNARPQKHTSPARKQTDGYACRSIMTMAVSPGLR